MTTLPCRTVRPAGPYPARVRWYRALAYGLAATRDSGAVFESSRTVPVPRITVRPASVLDAVPLSDPRLRLEDVPRSDGEPSGDWPDAYGVLVAPFPRFPSGAYRSEIGRGVPLDGSFPEAGEWVGVQTHWIRGASGEIWIARRYRIARPDARALGERVDRVGAALAEDWALLTGSSATAMRLTGGAARDWRRGTVRVVPREGWWNRGADALAGAAEVRVLSSPEEAAPEGHTVVFGASGAGKTTYLVDRAAREIAAGVAVVAIDLHADLTPGIVARLEDNARRRLVVIDASDRPIPGIAALSTAIAEDAAAAHLVAALKRLSPDGQDVYWGFRLERLFDAFVRLAQEFGGTLLDVFDLLTNAERRATARIATGRADLAHFLDELAPIVKRQPEFLWAASARLAKIVLVPGLSELLAPGDGGIPVEELLESGRSLLVRIPFAELGPEAASFAGSIILARLYLGIAARRRAGGALAPVVLVLDEAQALSPRLVAEILTESRKFGVRVILASQFPDRLADEVRGAAAGAPSEFVTFRVPPASAATVAGWIGLSAVEGERWLPRLPTGYAVRLDPATGSAVAAGRATATAAEGTASWADAVARTRAEFPPPTESRWSPEEDDPILERLLLGVFAAEQEGQQLEPGLALAAALALPGPAIRPELLGDRWNDVVRQRLIRVDDEGCRLTAAGARRLGFTRPTGGVGESAEHRGLILATFRLFARHGLRIEIVRQDRQGRWDTSLPDAIFRQLDLPLHATPAMTAEAIDAVRDSWAWRTFSGRDVHIEVEVSGARRIERIRVGCRKAAMRGAFALFIVGRSAQAEKIRRDLAGLKVERDRAQVWTLSRPSPPNP